MFVVLAIVVLIASFLIALTTLIREQRKIENEGNLEDKNKKITDEKNPADLSQVKIVQSPQTDDSTFAGNFAEKRQIKPETVNNFPKSSAFFDKPPPATERVPFPWEESTGSAQRSFGENSDVENLDEREESAKLSNDPFELSKAQDTNNTPKAEGSFYIKDILDKK